MVGGGAASRGLGRIRLCEAGLAAAAAGPSGAVGGGALRRTEALLADAGVGIAAPIDPAGAGLVGARPGFTGAGHTVALGGLQAGGVAGSVLAGALLGRGGAGDAGGLALHGWRVRAHERQDQRAIGPRIAIIRIAPERQVVSLDRKA